MCVIVEWTMYHLTFSYWFLNRFELRYYPVMINLDKCSGRCKSVDDLSTRACVANKTKDVNVKVFNTITNKNESKRMLKHISCDCKRKFISTTCNLNQKCQCECISYCTCKKEIIVGILPSACICGNGKYLKSIADD